MQVASTPSTSLVRRSGPTASLSSRRSRTCSTTTPQLVVLPDNETRDDVHFGSYKRSPSSRAPRSTDLNGNGGLDGGEPGLDGVTITVDTDGGPPPEFTQVTAGGGLYTFQIDGSGAVCRPTDRAPLAGPTTTSEPQLASTWSWVTGKATSALGHSTRSPSAGWPLTDLDGDGTQGAGEPGLPGVTIELDRDANGSVDATTLTGVGGTFKLLAPRLRPGHTECAR